MHPCKQQQISDSPEISPVFADVEYIIAHCLSTVLFHVLRPISFYKVEAPALKPNFVLQPIHPVYKACPQHLIGVVQICTVTLAIRTCQWAYQILQRAGHHMLYPTLNPSRKPGPAAVLYQLTVTVSFLRCSQHRVCLGIA